MSGLYVHIPFCHSKCAYCDFFSTPRKETIEGYIDSILTEYELRCSEISSKFTTIYIGGGTPSLLPEKLLIKLVNGLRKYVEFESLEEFTIEANPEDVTEEWCKLILSLGITRVSMGIQSFDDSQLKFIGRRHTASDAIRAIAMMQKAGITNISGDLIYGLPNQTLESWKDSLERLLSMGLSHFSAYLLSYEPATRLYVMREQGRVKEASEELAQQMYGVLIDMARRYNYEHYEISNFSKPGCKAVHNSNYWRDMPYLGLGVSAHSFDGMNRRYNPNNIKAYIKTIESGEKYCEEEIETEDERHNDYIIVSLRTIDGISLSYYKSHWGELRYNQLIETAQHYINNGQMIIKNNQLSIAEEHMLISDRIMVDFIV